MRARSSGPPAPAFMASVPGPPPLPFPSLTRPCKDSENPQLRHSRKGEGEHEGRGPQAARNGPCPQRLFDSHKDCEEWGAVGEQMLGLRLAFSNAVRRLRLKQVVPLAPHAFLL